MSLEFNVDDKVEVTSTDYVYNSYETMAEKMCLQLFVINKLPKVGGLFTVISKDYQARSGVILYGVTDGTESFVISGGSLKLVTHDTSIINIDIQTNIEDTIKQVQTLRLEIVECANEWKKLQNLIKGGFKC